MAWRIKSIRSCDLPLANSLTLSLPETISERMASALLVADSITACNLSLGFALSIFRIYLFIIIRWLFLSIKYAKAIFPAVSFLEASLFDSASLSFFANGFNSPLYFERRDLS